MSNPIALTLAAASLALTAAFAPLPVPALSADVSNASMLDDDTELATHMKAINTSMRKLRAVLKDPKRGAEAAELLLGMQSHALAAKALDPEKLGDVAEAERDAFRINYRKEMHRWLGQMFEIEIAIMEGRIDDANKTLKLTLKEKAPAHKQFQKKKD